MVPIRASRAFAPLGGGKARWLLDLPATGSLRRLEAELPVDLEVWFVTETPEGWPERRCAFIGEGRAWDWGDGLPLWAMARAFLVAVSAEPPVLRGQLVPERSAWCALRWGDLRLGEIETKPFRLRADGEIDEPPHRRPRAIYRAAVNAVAKTPH